MILLKNMLIFGIIKKIITLVCKVVYKLVSFVNLQLTLFVGVVGLILFLTGCFQIPWVVTVFYVVVCISIVYAIIATVRRLLGFGKQRVKRTKGVQIMDSANAQRPVVTGEQGGSTVVVNEQGFYPQVNQIKYYAVKNKPGYYFAEFNDKYVLYRLAENGSLVEIRTDYKGLL